VVDAHAVVDEDVTEVCGCCTVPAPWNTERFEVAKNMAQCVVQDDENWIGVPAIRMPRRAGPSGEHDAAATFEPTTCLMTMRLTFEFVRIITPPLVPILIVIIFLVDLDWLYELADQQELKIWFIWLGVYMSIMVFLQLFTALVKWVLVCQFTPGEAPLWSSLVWRNELIVTLCESVVDPGINDYLRGTPFVAGWLRLLGCKVGSYAYIDSLQFTEFDLVELGDECMIGRDATIQTHLFEDRIMKMSKVSIGKGVSLAAFSFCLYDSSLDEGASLHCLTLLMKGESLPKWTMWHGSPAKRYLDSDLLTTLTHKDTDCCCHMCCCS